MLSGIQPGFRASAWSVSVLARSLVYGVALAVLIGFWCMAGYQWLWLPESSGLMLVAAFFWILVLAVLAVAMLAGSVAAASAVVSGSQNHLSLRHLLSLAKRGFGWSLAVAAVGGLLAIVLVKLFGWVNEHSLNVASFLAFHLQRPVSYMIVEDVFWVVEALIWVILAGLFMSRLLVLANAGWKPARAGTTSARPPRRMIFITSVLSALVFGGLIWLVVGWHPAVRPGFWDYSQLSIRVGAALLLLSFGWLFWILSLARLVLPLTEPVASATQPAAR